jgi:hypothetical protein
LWRNAEGEIVESEADAFGLKSKYELIHPDLLKMETVRNTFVPEVEGLNNEQQQKTTISPFLASMLQTEIH